MVQIVISEEGIREIARDLYASVEGDLKQALSDLNRIIKEDLTSMHNLYLSLHTNFRPKKEKKKKFYHPSKPFFFRGRKIKPRSVGFGKEKKEKKKVCEGMSNL